MQILSSFPSLHTPRCLWETLHDHLDMLHGSYMLRVCLTLERQHVTDPLVSWQLLSGSSLDGKNAQYHCALSNHVCALPASSWCPPAM